MTEERGRKVDIEVEDEVLEAEELQEESVETEPVDEWREKALRLMAEMENLRKRTQKEVSEARQYAVTGFAREMLTVADNMERALMAMEDAGEGPEAIKTMREGVEMVADQLETALGKFQIRRFESMGEKLDPQRHQVMVEIESDETPGTVVQEMQPGYVIGDRLLRPALVGTAKGNKE